MCTKISKTPLFLIGGVCFVIVLVGITGVTLINNLNLSNIIKLNEKVASDSISAHGDTDTELNDDNGSYDDDDVDDQRINYANNHPRNIYKFDEFSAPYALAVGSYGHSASPPIQHHSMAETTGQAVGQASEDVGGSGGGVGDGGSLFSRREPVASLVDGDANNGNMARDGQRMSEAQPQPISEGQRQLLINSDTSANWQKVSGKFLPNRAAGSNANTDANRNVNSNATLLLATVINPQLNSMQSNASQDPTIAARAAPASDVSGLNNDVMSLSANTSTNSTKTSSAVTPASRSAASSSSVNVDLAAKLMLPLILNGSARLMQNINGESKHVDDTESDWGFPRDTGETKSAQIISNVSHKSLLPKTVIGADEEKRNQVVKMMQHAWDNYKLYAWGKNELRPLSQRPHSGSIFGAYDLGATIVDGLDTLYLMGLNKEYEEGRDWIERKFSLDNVSADLSVFETNIRFVGGMLTLYAFTGDPLYKEKAQYIADKLLPAFQTPTGIPYALVNTRTGVSRNYGWASGGSSILSEVGTLHCEFVYLSDITGNPLYRERVQNIRQVLKEIEKPKGLYPNFINPKTGKWGQMHMSLGALGDSFYEYLLKAWLQSGQTDEEAREMFDEAMLAINEHMIRSSNGGLTYVSDLKFDRLEHKMDHLACFAGGLFALAASTRQNQHANKFMEIGKGLTNTCHESYVRTATKLGPEAFRFGEAAEARALKSQEKYYILRPETIESYFVLWRLTHDQKYRDWGWEAVQALEAHCRTPHGYCGIKNVYQETPQKDDVQQSFFLAETLKYLYLLFSDDSLLPLDEWIFNTEAHPLPIRSANAFYRAAATSPLTQQMDETR